MATPDLYLIREHIAPLGFISAPLCGRDRDALEELAVLCGFPDAHVKHVEDADLVALYASARKRTESGPMVAARIARKIGVSPDAPRAPAPLPGLPTPPASGISEEAFKAILKPLLEAARDYTDDKVFSGINVLRDELPRLVGQEVADALKAMTATRLEIVRPDAPPLALGLVHRQTERVIRYLSRSQNVYLHGPAGSGKSTLGKQCADAFGLPFYAVAKVESEYLLLGFRTANGDVVRTPFRDAYEYGGVLLFDELDRSNPNAVTALNMALANKCCPFPDGLITMHPNFKVLAAGNTTMRGASHEYTAAQQSDASSVDRFTFIEFPYDEQLEAAIAPHAEWCAHVQAIRAAVLARGIDLLVTPRATLAGGELILAGEPWEEVEEAVIFKGLDAETANQIRRAIAPRPRAVEAA
jgi:MoxR-like ATPase